MKSKTSHNQSGSQDKANGSGTFSSQLMTLFEIELRDLYWGEKSLVGAISKMLRSARSKELIEVLENDIADTIKQASRIKLVFDNLGKIAIPKVCQAMSGLILGSEEILKVCEEGPMRDAGIISARQKIEHYEIASYGTLREFASTLGLSSVVELLEDSLNEKKAINSVLSRLAINGVNFEAAI